ncbi:MAG: hypothetical protein CSA20_07935 [Deltaproteobacteria bacterium]|nr:MAG: hypothetical protein CSB23_04390 [Deltaproteobacteria bacterium]PIE72464.1 MAG: hypothetical protein CSA20_07935 [Deltaproteobacteria bacterium]
MKRVLIGCMATLLVCLLAGSGFAAKYKPGVYKGSSPGRSTKKHPGNIAVEVTVSEDAITDIKLVEFTQTKDGKHGKLNEQVKEKIPAAILEKQSLQIDSVAKASMASVGLELAVAQALNEATVAYKDGKYTGKAKGHNKPPKHPGEIVVEVTIAGGKISDIQLVTFKQTTVEEKKKQGERNAKAKEQIPAAIIAAQTPAVDSVAKATMASDGIKIAVARALEQAR